MDLPIPRRRQTGKTYRSFSMKKAVLLLIVTALIVLSTTHIFAAGGKVRGENGLGNVYQIQVMDPPPFQN
jgi:hypothetical protein